MKKDYIQPSAEIVSIEPQGMMALSRIDVYNGSGNPSVGGGNAMSGHRGWDSDSWTDGEEE